MDHRAAQGEALLIVRIQAGETACFAELVHPYRAALMRVARSRLGRVEWAEEVMQETLLAAYRSLASYDPQRNFRTWLWTILLNECHRHFRRRQNGTAVESWSDEHAVPSANQQQSDAPLGRLIALERSEQLETLLGRLSTAQADALRLRFYGDLKFAEIAEAMHCSLNTAKQRVRTGLKRMAEMLRASEAIDSPRQLQRRES